MPDIRLQALPQATNLDQALAVGGESIYDLLGISPPRSGQGIDDGNRFHQQALRVFILRNEALQRSCLLSLGHIELLRHARKSGCASLKLSR